MKRRSHHNIAIANLAKALATAWALTVCNAVAQESCKLTVISSTAKISAACDSRTLVPDNGRELRLAAIKAGDDSPTRRVGSSTEKRSGLSGRARNSTAVVGWWLSLMRATPSNPCSGLC
jgi:hypothetical protein